MVRLYAWDVGAHSYTRMTHGHGVFPQLYPWSIGSSVQSQVYPWSFGSGIRSSRYPWSLLLQRTVMSIPAGLALAYLIIAYTRRVRSGVYGHVHTRMVSAMAYATRRTMASPSAFPG